MGRARKREGTKEDAGRVGSESRTQRELTYEIRKDPRAEGATLAGEIIRAWRNRLGLGRRKSEAA